MMESFLSWLNDYFVAHLTLILRLLAIVGLAWLGIRLAIGVQKRIEKRVIEKRIDPDQRARLKTLVRAGIAALEVVIAGGAVMMILRAFGIDITPLLASAGVAGLAVSLGAQTLIKDYISGALILYENTFQVGEMIEVNGSVGTVEQIDLRTTRLRDFSGKLITIPNGEIRILANASRDWSRAIVDINLAVDADLGQAIAALQSATQLAAQDETLQPLLLETPQIQGWNNLSEWAVQVRIMAKTLPGKQYETAIALRRVTLDALKAAGVNLATPPFQSLPSNQPGN